MLEEYKDIKKILDNSKASGWVLEPDAKKIMEIMGLDVPGFVLTNSLESARDFMKKQNQPVVAKAVSKKILHKTEHNAVSLGISSSDYLEQEFNRLKKLDGCENILIEEMVKGIELIIGAKNDFQFGPVIVFGLGGTSVEIYNDTAIRMAPLTERDVVSMVESLKAKEIISGYRGQQGVNMEALTRLLIKFSNFIMEFETALQSIDFNPVICTKDKCVIADARIILE
jgi:hypothetical protein